MTVPAGHPPQFPAASARSGWRRRGGELVNQVSELAQRGQDVLGGHESAGMHPDEPRRAAELISTLTCLCVERLREGPDAETCAELSVLVCDLQQLALELYEHEAVSRTRRIAACETGLARLRPITASADLLERCCEELARSCRLERVVLGKVEDEAWTPWMSHFDDPTSMTEWSANWINTPIPLVNVLESELLSEHRPELVHDTTGERIHAIIRDGVSRSYVVAPVMPNGNVVGFIHADHGAGGRPCDETDRDVLFTFAEGFGHTYERCVLGERLRLQRDQVRATLSTLDDAMGALTNAELDLAEHPDVSVTGPRTAVSVLTTMSANLEELTPREMEVLELMVSGAKNQKIAEQLVITEGTVKSHVKHILRKMGAVNRSQAIAQYLGVLGDV